MQFTSLQFLLVFLPALMIAYYVVPVKYRNIMLLIVSLLFYSCGSSSFLIIMCILTILNIGLAWMIKSNRERCSILSMFYLVLGISINVCTLGYHKYLRFFINTANTILRTDIEVKNILLPLGISFYTFKAISYLVDVYCNKIERVLPIEAATYLSFFAQIQSGPIDRYNSFSDIRNFSEEFIADGIVRFMTGFVKKVLIADVLSNIVSEAFDSTQSLSTSLAWLGAICFSLQLYYDFSGYSDMAIGLGKMLGIDCKQNFDYPYTTKSISEFWRRWHISLGSWFRDYVYIPLGGSRVSRVRTIFNLFFVWFLTGLWHGAGWQYIAWGIGYFVLISAEKIFDVPNRFKTKITRIVYRIFTLLVVNFQWVLFRSNGLMNGLRYIKKMIIYTNSGIAPLRARFLLDDYKWFILVAIIFSTPICNEIKKRVSNKKVLIMYEIVEGVVLVALFIVSVSFIVSGQNSPFLYGNF